MAEASISTKVPISSTFFCLSVEKCATCGSPPYIMYSFQASSKSRIYRRRADRLVINGNLSLCSAKVSNFVLLFHSSTTDFGFPYDNTPDSFAPLLRQTHVKKTFVRQKNKTNFSFGTAKMEYNKSAAADIAQQNSL